MNTVKCQHCDGTGQVAEALFNAGDRVIWKTGGWWGDCPAVVVRTPSKIAKRVKIKTDANAKFNGGNPWITYVSFARVALASPSAKGDVT